MSILANDKMRLIITGKCNLDCFYCHNEGQAKEDSFVKLQDLQAIADALSSKSVTVGEVTISGGEPFLHPRLDDIVAMAATFCHRVTMVSNGLMAQQPARLASLTNKGLKKLRLGVDSLDVTKPRPSPGYLDEPFVVSDVLKMAATLGLQIDMNVVVTRFNRRQVGRLARFAVANGISIKFFEHVEVRRFGADGYGGTMAAIPHVSFREFEAEVQDALGSHVRFDQAIGFGEANMTCVTDGVEIRYCRYLCVYNLCWLTGTRVDAQGYVYNCMSNRGVDRIQHSSSSSSILDTIELASMRPCRAGATEKTTT